MVIKKLILYIYMYKISIVTLILSNRKFVTPRFVTFLFMIYHHFNYLIVIDIEFIKINKNLNLKFNISTIVYIY